MVLEIMIFKEKILNFINLSEYPLLFFNLFGTFPTSKLSIVALGIGHNNAMFAATSKK